MRVAFTPSEISDYNSICSIERTDNFFTQTYNDVLVQNSFAHVSFFTLCPAIERNFSIETNKNNNFQDTVLYFVDPRRPDCDYYASFIQLKSTFFDDDSGGNLQAKISLNARSKTTPFLIIAATYSRYTDSNFFLKILNLNTTFWDYL